MIELEDRGVCEPAVGADAGTQNTEDVRPRRRAPDVSSITSLLSVEVAALANVLPATVFAARLTVMEIGSEQHPATAIAELRGLPYNPGCGRSGRHGLRHVPRPVSSLRTHTNIGSRMRCNGRHT